MSLLSLNAVTVDGYRLHTGDQTTAASAVSGALLEAQQLLEEELRRKLDLAERTASFRIHQDGRVYPNAWPITDAGDLVIDGRMVVGAVPDAGPFTAIIAVPPAPRSTITWTGGFDADTLPATLRNALYDLAQPIAQGASPIPGGATSLSVGDVSVGFASPTSGGLDALVPGLASRVAKWRNRWV